VDCMVDGEARPGIYLGCGGAWLCPLTIEVAYLRKKTEREVESSEPEALSCAFDRIF
jgi:hypothetical protein